jgi:hypothetical protein
MIMQNCQTAKLHAFFKTLLYLFQTLFLFVCSGGQKPPALEANRKKACRKSKQALFAVTVNPLTSNRRF